MFIYPKRWQNEDEAFFNDEAHVPTTDLASACCCCILMLSIDNTLNSPSAAAMKIIPSLALPLSPSNNNSQKLNYENDNTYDEIEEPWCNNNQPKIYNGNQELCNHSINTILYIIL